MARTPSFYLGAALIVIMFAVILRERFTVAVAIDVAVQRRAEGRTGRRPMPRAPHVTNETFVIDEGTSSGNRMGTAFAVARNGVWLTAAHVTRACSRVGLVGGDEVRSVTRVTEDQRDDVALMIGGFQATDALTVADDLPPVGSAGYQLGFPEGAPAIIVAQFLGTTSTAHQDHEEVQLLWTESERFPAVDGPLGGVSGAPVLAADGRVVGLVSASTPRRGRILTTTPDALRAMIAAHPGTIDGSAPMAIRSVQDALDRYRHFLRNGAIRQVYCDVE